MNANWTTPEHSGTLPPPPAWTRTYGYEPGDLVAVKGLDFACEVSVCYAGYASLLTIDGNLINRPLQDLAPFCGQVSEEEAEELFLQRDAALRALQAHEDAQDGKDLAGFVCGYFLAFCLWSMPVLILLWIGAEVARRW